MIHHIPPDTNKCSYKLCRQHAIIINQRPIRAEKRVTWSESDQSELSMKTDNRWQWERQTTRMLIIKISGDTLDILSIKIVTIQVQVRVKSQKDLEWLSSAVVNCCQIFTVDLNNQDKLSKVKFKIQFQNSIQDCDIVESNSSKD